ncbi:MAG: hypothetical protein LC781_11470 [Actinobacteria bacterium]|nr:hypothetical protein [Actinomycetota bacterium]
MDDRQQRKVDEAAEKFAGAIRESFEAVAERGVSAQQLNAELTQSRGPWRRPSDRPEDPGDSPARSADEQLGRLDPASPPALACWDAKVYSRLREAGVAAGDRGLRETAG